MAINGVRATGDDQAWKREDELKMAELERRIEALERVVRYLMKLG